MIKRAGVEHVDLLVNASAKMLQDFPLYQDFRFDIEHTKTVLHTYLQAPCIGCFYITDKAEVVGILLCIVGAPLFTPEKEMSELMFWIRPDHRSYAQARELIKHAEQWGKSEGAVRSKLAAASGYATNLITKLYSRMGYTATGIESTKEM